MNKKKQFTEEQITEFVNFAKKYGIYKTCEKYGVIYQVMRRVLRENGVKTQRHCKQNICMFCKRSARFIEFPCPWAHKFQPVEGWTATEVSYKDALSVIKTYKITDCPLYMPDD